MTIFLEIAKRILTEATEKLSKDSADADNSLLNGALTLIGFGRDLVLAGEKRALLSGLTGEIRALSAATDDAENLKNITELIYAAKSRGIDMSVAAKYDEGKLGEGLLTMQSLLETVHAKLGGYNLLDVVKDDDPLNCFRFFVAQYLAERVAQDLNKGLLEKLYTHPQVSSLRTIAIEKEGLVRMSLDALTRRLETLDSKHTRFEETKKETVVEAIRALRRANQALCAAPGATLLRPTPGRLELLMCKAEANITKPPLSPGLGRLGFLGAAAVGGGGEGATSLSPTDEGEPGGPTAERRRLSS